MASVKCCQVGFADVNFVDVAIFVDAVQKFR